MVDSDFKSCILCGMWAKTYRNGNMAVHIYDNTSLIGALLNLIVFERDN